MNADKIDNYEIFISQDGTQYMWDKSQEMIVNLSEEELQLIKLKVNLMSDNEILNTESKNGITMGIPIQLNRIRLTDLTLKIIEVIKNEPKIIFSDHVIERLVLESMDENNDKRGWEDEDDVKCCLFTAKKVTGVRLNVNHNHPEDTEKVKHLHPYLALVIQGKKLNSENGRLVLVIFIENQVKVITIL